MFMYLQGSRFQCFFFLSKTSQNLLYIPEKEICETWFNPSIGRNSLHWVNDSLTLRSVPTFETDILDTSGDPRTLNGCHLFPVLATKTSVYLHETGGRRSRPEGPTDT